MACGDCSATLSLRVVLGLGALHQQGGMDMIHTNVAPVPATPLRSPSSRGSPKTAGGQNLAPLLNDVFIDADFTDFADQCCCFYKWF